MSNSQRGELMPRNQTDCTPAPLPLKKSLREDSCDSLFNRFVTSPFLFAAFAFAPVYSPPMFRFAVALMAACLIAASCAEDARPAPPASAAEIHPLTHKEDLSDYALAWSDDFNGDALDTSAWDYRLDKWYWSAQKAENVSVSGGYLHIALKKESAGKMEYTAGGVISKRSFKYGYYEASFKCPDSKGWHTAFALTPHKQESTGVKQELDVCDTDSIDTKTFSANFQLWKPSHRQHGAKRVKSPDLSADFHVWGCEFTPKKVRYFFDGELVATMEATGYVAPTKATPLGGLDHDDQSIWLSVVAAPLSKTDKVDDTKLPAEALFDWVRYYAPRSDAKK